MRAVAELARRPEAALFVLVLIPYAYFYQAGGWNQNSRFDLTRAIVEHGSASIEPYHHNTGDKSQRQGLHYCDKAPGASWLGVPAYGVVYAVFGPDRPDRDFLNGAAYAVTVWAVGIPSAAAVVMLYLLVGAFGLSERARLAVALAYGLGTLAFPYATLFYGHQLIAALLLSGFALLVRARHAGGPTPRWVAALAGGLLGFAVVVEYPAALAVVPITAYAARFVRPWPRLLWLVGAGAACAVALAAYHWAVFGGPLTLPYEFSTQTHRHRGWFMGLGVPRWEAVKNILFTPFRGLLYSAPWLALAVPGAVALLRRARLRAEAVVCAVIAVLFVWLNASLVDWQGGWTMGPRYLVPAIPFVAILASGCAVTAAGVRGRALARAGWALALVAAAYSGFLMLAGTAVKPEVPVHVRAPFGQYLLPKLYAGELSISTQGIDTAGYPRQGPSRAWNWGELLGLEGLAELVPLALLMACAGTWLWWAATSGRGARAGAAGG